MHMIYPKPLEAGDRIAIVSPASKIDPALVDGACRTLSEWGFRPEVSEFCKGESGSFSGTVDERLRDLRRVFSDSGVRAVLCSRGGYGVVQLLEHFDVGMFRRDPKWLIGFSDISVLHAYSSFSGVASIHASMCKHLVELPDDECSRALRSILAGELPDYTVEGNPLNREGSAEGTLSGGNMAVLTALLSTPYNLLKRDHILFIEDISEAIYKIERMLYTMRLDGTFEHTRGLIVGQFTDYKPSIDHSDMYEMISSMVEGYDFPVAYGFPVGHVDRNLPLVEGAYASLTVSKENVRLSLRRQA